MLCSIKVEKKARDKRKDNERDMRSEKKKFPPVTWIKLWQTAVFAWHPRMHSCVWKVSQNALHLAPLAAEAHANVAIYAISTILSVDP